MTYPEGKGDEISAGSREHTHELLERPERAPQLEVERHLVDTFQVCV